MKLSSQLFRFAGCAKAVQACAVLVCAAALLVPAESVHAAWVVAHIALGGSDDDEAVVIQWLDPETGVQYVEVIYKDGSEMVFPLINPNPEDGVTTPGDWDSMADLLKQQGGTGYLIPSWQNTPLGAALSDKGPGPYHNPGEGGDYGGLSPSNVDFFNPREFSEDAMKGGGVGGALNLDGNGGSFSGQLRNTIRRGKKGNDDDDGDGAKPADGGFWGDDLPGPPELVNPAWSTDAWTANDWELFLLIESELANEKR